MKTKFRSFTQLLDEHLQNPDFAIEFLNQAFADDDLAAFKQSLKDVLRIYGSMTELSARAKISRGTLYKMTRGKGQTEIGTLIKLLHSLGYNLTVTKQRRNLKHTFKLPTRARLRA